MVSRFARRRLVRKTGRPSTPLCGVLRTTSAVWGRNRVNPIVVVLNGPNLNLLGKREPEIYGRETLADVEADCRRVGKELGLAIEFHQSNREYEIIDLDSRRPRARGRHCHQSRRLHPHLGRHPRCAERFRRADHRGAHFQRAQARAFPPSFLCVGRRFGRHRRLRNAGLRLRAAPDCEADRRAERDR